MKTKIVTLMETLGRSLNLLVFNVYWTPPLKTAKWRFKVAHILCSLDISF